ncbi:unnamed protein product [Cladocopium goreaui]|uniref:Uncharacterized protein n=1 Tax=Cladocopium goreaui TaxID=2562237 RepID=A0A9P1D1V9_9DINO|nr:unnamed protein product [Cladocopium goreaui]
MQENVSFDGHHPQRTDGSRSLVCQMLRWTRAANLVWRARANASLAQAVLNGDAAAFEREVSRLRSRLTTSGAARCQAEDLLKQLGQAVLAGNLQSFQRLEQQLRSCLPRAPEAVPLDLDAAVSLQKQGKYQEAFEQLLRSLEVMIGSDELHPTALFDVLDQLEELVMGGEADVNDASLSFLPVAPLALTARERLAELQLDRDGDGGVVLQKLAQALLYAADDPGVATEAALMWRRRALEVLRHARELMEMHPELAELCAVATLQIDLTEDLGLDLGMESGSPPGTLETYRTYSSTVSTNMLGHDQEPPLVSRSEIATPLQISH